MLFRRTTTEAVFIGRAPRLRRSDAREALDSVASSGAGMAQLRSVLALESSAAAVAWLSDAEVLDALAARVAEGRLALVGHKPALKVPPVKREPPPPPPEAPPRETSWLEIELKDEEGAPVAFARYRVDLPDGRIMEGDLDAEGRARVEGVEPGTGKVSFPDLDSPDWRLS